jgi:hypothetical protein
LAARHHRSDLRDRGQAEHTPVRLTRVIKTQDLHVAAQKRADGNPARPQTPPADAIIIQAPLPDGTGKTTTHRHRNESEL